MRRKRRPARVLPTDSRMELRNKDLADWNANYLQNMDAVIKSKKNSRVAQGAKKAAEYFVWGSGIGKFSHASANHSAPNPFAMFTGDALFELATGLSRTKVAGKKHDRDSGIDDETQAQSRRVRQKTHAPDDRELGRGLDDDMPLGADDVELPREAGTALDEQHIFSSMPWNISASKHGSSAIPRSGRLDQGRAGSRPGSRLVSASPLHGRGAPLSLDALRSLDSDVDVGMGGDDFALPGPSSPSTVIGSPRRTSTHVEDALGPEGENFLKFVSEAIRKRNVTEVRDEGIQFQQLIPPSQHSKTIACQGLMMVLTLGTKGMLDVQQPENFGDISLKLTQKAKTSQVVDISDRDESGEEDGVHENFQVEQEAVEQELEDQTGHFDEQFAAGHASGGAGENDDLYDD
jgi:meiotic recombination protein REC8